jgi:hypothetical protein
MSCVGRQFEFNLTQMTTGQGAIAKLDGHGLSLGVPSGAAGLEFLGSFKFDNFNGWYFF